MELKIITLEDLELTEEEMQEIIDTIWGRHIPPLVAVSRGNRAINKAVAVKAMEILNRSINPMDLVKDLLEANVTVDPDYLKKISKDSEDAKS